MTRIISTTINNIKTYHITSESALPDQYGDKANRRIGKHSELKNQIKFIQEFEFSNCSQIIQQTNDGLNLAVSGTYPSQIKIYDLADLSQTTTYSLKEIPLYFNFITDDRSKIVVLRGDRKLDFYLKDGICFHTEQLPCRCRHFWYNPSTADLLLASEDSKILKLNLFLGQYEEPIQCSHKYVNCVTVSKAHQLIACGYEEGAFEFFDPRDTTVSLGALKLKNEVTKLCFDDKSGIKMAAGCSDGSVLMFDIRSSTPQFTYKHRNQEPIHSLQFHTSGKIISGDKRGCRIYNEDGSFYTSFDTNAAMNSLISYPNSGLLFATVDSPKIQAMLIPDLGPSPRWASYLDELILDVNAESEESTPLYDNMRFITREELEKCKMEHLINTSILKPYMHGFFIPIDFYRMIKNPDTEEAINAVNKWKEEKRLKEKENSIVATRKAAKKDYDDLEKLETDSKRKARKKKEMRNDPYYQD